MICFRSKCYLKMNLVKYPSRMKSDYLKVMIVRQHFLDYFGQEDHLTVRSSPVKPFCDPTLEFVNAGMNQFKNVFLGLASPSCLRAVNSQKCIRIGGKHNDLHAVGYDTYHHTFFEMLGNWSFGDYFKADACKYAWKLITSKPYSLDPERLYVTYFKGDSKLSLPPDLETKEIWREIGIKEDRILPFGTKDNFWEMGSTGPCGPCTEIHYDHLGTATRSEFVNSDLPDLTELWNLVFIQYNKHEDGSLIPLKQNFVDTGMGLERLTAILQGKRSNYDTDLFTPLFQKITQISKARMYEGKFGVNDPEGIDTNYRILADHVRMITVSMADNVFPDESHGLRRVIRKSLVSSEKFCPGKGLDLIVELTKVVGEILGPVYPEILKNDKQIKYLLINEDELWKQVQSNVKEEWKQTLQKNKRYETLQDVQSHGLISAIKELERMDFKHGTELNPDFALILYDRFGLTAQIIEELANINGYSIDSRQLEFDIIKLKEKNKSLLYSSSNLDSIDALNNISSSIKPTDDSYKYDYSIGDNGQYNYKELTAQVQAILSDGKCIKPNGELKSNTKVGIILDKTNFWTSLKGDSDRGTIRLFNKFKQKIGDVNVENATHYGSFVIHNGIFKSKTESVDLDDILPRATVYIDPERRLTLMQNNTAAHLLTNIIKSKYTANIQTFINSAHHFTARYSFYGEDITEGELILMEHFVNIMIKEGINIQLSKVIRSELDLNDVNIPPYLNLTSSDTFPLISFGLGNQLCREFTTGPVVYNSEDILEFSLVSIELNRKKRECTLRGLTGTRVHDCYEKTNNLLGKLNNMDFKERNINELEDVRSEAKSLIAKNLVPLSLRIELNHLVNNLNKAIKVKNLEQKKQLMKDAVTAAKENNKAFVIHYSDEESKLEKLTKICDDLPVMVFAYNNGHLTGRCTVPESSRLAADVWMTRVCEMLGSQINYYLGHNSSHVCGMKPLKLNKSTLDDVIEKAKNYAEIVAIEFLEEDKRL